jgi:hypothetical protein
MKRLKSWSQVSCSQNFTDRFLKRTAAVDILQLGQYQNLLQQLNEFIV